MCFRSSVLDRLVAQLDSAKTRHAMEHETLLSRMVAGNMPFLVCRRRKVFNFVQTISPKVFTVLRWYFGMTHDPNNCWICDRPLSLEGLQIMQDELGFSVHRDCLIKAIPRTKAVPASS
jgi:hypothetical protein